MDNSKDEISEIANEVPIIGQNIVQQLKKDTEKSERAFKIFNSGIKRAENLLNINLDANQQQLSIAEDKLLDSYRAVIVLSISALDAYIKTFLIVEIKQCLEQKTYQMI